LDIGHTSFATLEGPTSLCDVASLAARTDYVLALHRFDHSLLAVDYALSGRAKGARVAGRTGVKNPIAPIKSFQDPNKLYSVVSVVECHHDASESCLGHVSSGAQTLLRKRDFAASWLRPTPCCSSVQT